MNKYNIGLYVRLSIADRDLKDQETKNESESISHQKDMLVNFIQSKDELANCPYEIFFDDGYSGTNFSRPSFEKLLSKIKNGEIDLVIVKDFSRFGRDYIELGDYLRGYSRILVSALFRLMIIMTAMIIKVPPEDLMLF